MWPLILAGAGAGLGLMNQQYKRNQEKENMMANAEAIRYSPWTKMDPKMMGKSGTSPWMNMLSGGLTGAMMGSQLGGAGGAPAEMGAADKMAMAQGAADVNQYQGTGKEYDSNIMMPARQTVPSNTSIPQGGTWGGMRPAMVSQNQPPNYYSPQGGYNSPWTRIS